MKGILAAAFLLAVLLATPVFGQTPTPLVYSPGVQPGTQAKWAFSGFYNVSYLQMNVTGVSGSNIAATLYLTEANGSVVSQPVTMSVTDLAVVSDPIFDNVTATLKSWSGAEGVISVDSVGFVNGTSTITLSPGLVNASTSIASGSSVVYFYVYAPSPGSQKIGIYDAVQTNTCVPGYGFSTAPDCSHTTFDTEYGYLTLVPGSRDSLITSTGSNTVTSLLGIGGVSLPPLVVSKGLQQGDQLGLNLPLQATNDGVVVTQGSARTLIGASYSSGLASDTAAWDQSTGILFSYDSQGAGVKSIRLISTNAFASGGLSPYLVGVYAWNTIASILGGQYSLYFWGGVSYYLLAFAGLSVWDATRKSTVMVRLGIRSVVVILAFLLTLIVLAIAGVI